MSSSAVRRLETLKLNGILQFIVKERTKTTETEQEESQRILHLQVCLQKNRMYEKDQASDLIILHHSLHIKTEKLFNPL